MEGQDTVKVSETESPYWLHVWKTEEMPGFDKQSVSPALLQLITADAIPEGRALVPGCGRGYDVFALASLKRHCVGVDLVETAVQKANEYMESLRASGKTACK